MDWQTTVVLFIVAACMLVLVRRAVQLLSGNASSCSGCPNSSEKNKPTVRSLPLAQIEIKNRDQ